MENLIPKDLFDALACPVCRAGLRYSKDRTSLICVKCSQKYPISNEVPILLIPKGIKR